MLFAVANAGVGDVSDIVDTLVTVKVRMVNKAAETMLRDGFMTCSRGDLVSPVWRTVFEPTSASKGMQILGST